MTLIKTAFQWLGTLIISLFTSLYERCVDLLNWFIKFVEDGFVWLYAWFRQTAYDLIQPALDALKNSPLGDFALMSGELFANLNFFFPLSELLSVCFALLSFWLICLGLKIILKAIPTVY